MLPLNWKKTAVSALTAELSKASPKERAVGNLEQIINPTDEPRTHHVGTTEAPILHLGPSSLVIIAFRLNSSRLVS